MGQSSSRSRCEITDIFQCDDRDRLGSFSKCLQRNRQLTTCYHAKHYHWRFQGFNIPIQGDFSVPCVHGTEKFKHMGKKENTWKI